MDKAAKMVRVFFAVGFVAAMVCLIRDISQYREARDEYRRLADSFSDNLEQEKRGRTVDGRSFPAFLALRNPDYVFWIRIPGTAVNYPVVKDRTEGFYLNHTFEGEENPGGCLFVSDSFESLEADNTILYGHNMKDGSMFSDLKKYVEREFLDSHPDIFLHDGLGWRQYRIFACQICGESDVEVYSQSMGKADWSNYLDEMVRKSFHKTELHPMETDRIITLSTCFGSRKRMIVQAVLLCYTE